MKGILLIIFIWISFTLAGIAQQKNGNNTGMPTAVKEYTVVKNGKTILVREGILTPQGESNPGPKIQEENELPQMEPLIQETRNARLARACLLYTSPSPRDLSTSRMPSSA